MSNRKQTIKPILLSLTALIALCALAAPAQDQDRPLLPPQEGKPLQLTTPTQQIQEPAGMDLDDSSFILGLDSVLAQEEDLTIFSRLLNKAQMRSELNTLAPVTILAPSDQAFLNTDTSALERITNDREGLRQWLRAHLAGDVVDPQSLAPGRTAEVETEFGNSLIIRTEGTTSYVGNAEVTQLLYAQNGLILVLDRPLFMPGAPNRPAARTAQTRPDDTGSTATQSIAATLRVSRNHQVLRELLRKALLDEKLATPEVELTLFAPTDAAFEKLPPEVLLALSSSPAQLRNVMAYHIVDQALAPEDLCGVDFIPPNSGEQLQVRKDRGEIVLGSKSRIQGQPVLTRNGIVYAIDDVLMPARMVAALRIEARRTPAPAEAAEDGQAGAPNEAPPGGLQPAPAGPAASPADVPDAP
ncbi:MAG: fasciclin domain-containing protein [Sumerlaeia bacterium]